ncbi:sulfatase-like hydrolase/transferase [Geminicoccus roseus]|uniref:sulfatase-like hydrolase/transferase n=1 Tax=Geminicoccus roseus TaxID=404900 RepID=UPI00040A5C06|nr:sulfatase-like hydrolase/transferase [Geminicoccus roseus]
MSQRPNIVVLIADDHRHQSIGANGNDEVRSPNLDALARRGTVFDGAHCQGGMHPAICVPSRASLMTGRNVFTSSVDPAGADYEGTAFAIPADLQTFPERLRAHGYHTHGIGKWHNDIPSFARSFASGERLMFGGMSDHDRVPMRHYDETGQFPAEDIHFEEGFSTDLFAESAIRFLREYQADDPFCLYVAFTAPHDPRTPPAAFAVDPEAVTLPPNLLPMHPFDNGEMLVRDEMLEAFPRTSDAIRRHLADYYGMIAHLDDAIGNILATLAETGRAENTLVVYTADHGIAIGQHGLMGKQNLYEHSIHVPLMLAGPGIPSGRRLPHLVWHADTHATLLDAAGIAPDPASEGESLLPVIDGQADAPRSTFAAAYRFGQRMIRDERYKLIRYVRNPEADLEPSGNTPPVTAGSETEQLFDLAVDPWEMANLACLPEMQPIRARLGEALDAWQREVGDPMLERAPAGAR